jgi:hypothetical protein
MNTNQFNLADTVAMTRLVNDLNKLPETEARNDIIASAKSLLYSDFSSRLIHPKMELVKNLYDAGYVEIGKKAIAGDYDS